MWSVEQVNTQACIQDTAAVTLPQLLPLEIKQQVHALS